MDQCPNCGEWLDEPEYFDDFSTVTGNHIIVGGRIIGKTELLVRRAVALCEDGHDVEILTPQMSMCRRTKDRVREKIGVTNLTYSTTDMIEHESGGSILFDSTASLHGFDRSTAKVVDAVLVDEAQEVPESVWLSLDRFSDEIPLLVFAGTPKPTQTILGGFAEYNTKYDTWHIPATSRSSPVSEGKVDEQYDYLSARSFASEIKAEYWIGDQPTVRPDHDYS
jgi:hypothetical protein